MNSNEMCRTCLNFDEEMTPLFDNKAAVTCVGTTTIVDILKNNCDIWISPDDSYPQQICIKCLQEVQRAFYFRLKCKKSETKLRLRTSYVNGKNNQDLKELLALNTDEQDTIVKEELEISDISEEFDDSDNCSSNQDFVCPSCSDVFQSVTAMRKHLIENHANEPITDKDSASNIRQANCSEHVERNTADLVDADDINGAKRIFKCTDCSRVCYSNARLKEHMRVHTKEKPYKCETCFKEFGRKDTLDNHLISHSNDRPHECPNCSKKFKRKDTLTKHMKIVHSDPDPTSQNDQEEFLRETEFNENKFEAESNEKIEYKCEICSKRFDQKRNLYQHKRVHSEVKRFKCDLCSKRFAWKKCLITHMRTHNNERPFECSICPASFKQKPHLQKHLLDLHSTKPIGIENSDNDGDDRADEDERPFKCESCHVSFKLIAGLTKHKKKFHEKPKQVKLDFIV